MNKEFFQNNRNKLSNVLEDSSVVVLFAGKSIKRSADEDYQFSPNRNFYYLTGITESDDILVMTKNASTIFINRFDELKAKWNGATLLDNEARELSGIKNVSYLDEFMSFLGKFFSASMPNPFTLYLDFDRLSIDKTISEVELFSQEIKNKYPHITIKNANPLLAKCRMEKSELEIEQIVKANSITKIALEEVLKNIRPEIYEYQIESIFDQQIKWNNASGFAFRTIAAAGKNACVLHYSANNCILNKDDLMLFDLGAEYDLYKSDISRTYPISGKFTSRQKELYNIVLAAQEKVFNAIKPGITTKELNQIVIDHYAVELKTAGVIKDSSEVSKYYFHGVSHHLGLDTHDINVGGPLTEGCVITVEPGLYIPEENIGIRIEDDVLVTKNGYKNLSEGIIKTVDEIEAFMKKKNSFTK